MTISPSRSIPGNCWHASGHDPGPVQPDQLGAADGNITMDQRTYELSSPTGSFRLANREFQILELLMQNPGNLISAERLMEKIWGYDSETEISVVWVYISYLRKKLSALGANIQIRATRNVGYCLEEIA